MHFLDNVFQTAALCISMLIEELYEKKGGSLHEMEHEEASV
jgi:hypothetical protein